MLGLPISVVTSQGTPTRDPEWVSFSTLDSCTWGWNATSVEALETQLINLIDFTLWLWALRSDNAFSGVGWLLRHLLLVLIQSMLLPPASFYYFPPVQQASMLVLSSIALLLGWATGGKILASVEFNLSISPHRCFAMKSFRCRCLDVLEIH